MPREHRVIAAQSAHEHCSDDADVRRLNGVGIQGTRPCTRRLRTMSRETNSWIKRLGSFVASEAALIVLMIMILAAFLVTLYGPNFLS